MIADELLMHRTVAITTHFCITHYKFIKSAVSCCLALMLSVREAGADQTVFFFFGGVAQKIQYVKAFLGS